ncbi:Uma2 family endonuclease [Luteolibacter sp. Populi]|uniref:Uma2 family endonuclease n=1 Tax=Luteolibacter sp. Populi TaxID=3230487 RepID=UPI0034659D1C
MATFLQPSPVSIEDYLAGEDCSETKHEFIGGAVYAMADGTNDHAAISANAVGALGGLLRGKPCRPFTCNAKVRIEYPDHTRFYYPDAQVVCLGNPGSDRFQEYPAVIIEVLNDSTRRIDLSEKRDAYLTIPSLKVLLLVDSERPYVLAHRRRGEGGFAGEEWQGLDAVIPLPEIEAELALADLYERIAFADASP